MASSRVSRIAELTKGRWREFRREPSAFFFVLFMPILWMAILGFAFSSSAPERYGVGWLKSPERTITAGAALAALRADPRLSVTEGTMDELLPYLKRGDLQLITAMPDAEAEYSFDPVNRVSGHARAYVDGVIQRAAGRRDPVVTQDQPMTITGTRYIDFLVPGLMALSIMTSSLFGTGMLIVSNRRENLLKRYLATPMRPVEYIISHLFGRSFILAMEVVTILFASFAMFRFQVAGSYLSLAVFAVLGAGSFTTLAILCGSRTANPATMNGMTNLISIPMMLVSGVWFSRANFPEWISEAARFLPLSALVDGLRRIALEGASLGSLTHEIAVLTAYLLAATIAASRTFKWY